MLNFNVLSKIVLTMFIENQSLLEKWKNQLLFINKVFISKKNRCLIIV